MRTLPFPCVCVCAAYIQNDDHVLYVYTFTRARNVENVRTSDSGRMHTEYALGMLERAHWALARLRLRVDLCGFVFYDSTYYTQDTLTS